MPGRLLPKLFLTSKYKSISPVDKEQVSDQLTMFVGLNRMLKMGFTNQEIRLQWNYQIIIVI